MAEATAGIGELRAEPAASGVPSAARIVPRGGMVAWSFRCSSPRSPGKSSGAPNRTPALVPLPTTGTSRVSDRAPNMRVRATMATGTKMSCGLPTRRTRSESSVAVAAARRKSPAKRGSLVLCREPGSSSAYIAG